MTELLKIQKTFRRLKTLFVVFAAICFALAAAATAAAIIWGIKGESYLTGGDSFLSRVAEALDFGGGSVTLGLFIMDAISFFALGALLVLTVRCLRAETKEGTPFSDTGARRTRTLGLLYFFISLGTEMAAVILRESFSVVQAESLGIVGGMATGVTLLVMSSLMRYGTRLQDMLMLKDVPLPEPAASLEPPLEEEADAPLEETGEEAPEEAERAETE